MDREIAAELGIHPGSAARLRERLGLEPNGHERKRGRRRAWRPDREARPLYERGWNDREIASALGVSRATVSRWRRSAGLRSNSRRWRGRGWDHREARRLHRQGLNDVEIGRRLGVTRETILRWRRRHGFAKDDPRGRKAIKPGHQK